MDSDWTPDVLTLEWGLASIDESAIGAMIVKQLTQRIPEIEALDQALLGEAAVESVLFTLIASVDDPHGRPAFGGRHLKDNSGQ